VSYESELKPGNLGIVEPGGHQVIPTLSRWDVPSALSEDLEYINSLPPLPSLLMLSSRIQSRTIFSYTKTTTPPTDPGRVKSVLHYTGDFTNGHSGSINVPVQNADKIICCQGFGGVGTASWPDAARITLLLGVFGSGAVLTVPALNLHTTNATWDAGAGAWVVYEETDGTPLMTFVSVGGLRRPKFLSPTTDIIPSHPSALDLDIGLPAPGSTAHSEFSLTETIGDNTVEHAASIDASWFLS
jgi:hypothetical protein